MIWLAYFLISVVNIAAAEFYWRKAKEYKKLSPNPGFYFLLVLLFFSVLGLAAGSLWFMDHFIRVPTLDSATDRYVSLVVGFSGLFWAAFRKIFFSIRQDIN
jgi:hypothetical protein